MRAGARPYMSCSRRGAGRAARRDRGGVDRACRELEIPVTDFQGEVSGAVVHTVVSVSAAGVRQDQKAANGVKTFRREAAAQREIIMCGYAGLEGTLRILDEAQTELETRFVSAFLEQTKGLTVELARPARS